MGAVGAKSLISLPVSGRRRGLAGVTASHTAGALRCPCRLTALSCEMREASSDTKPHQVQLSRSHRRRHNHGGVRCAASMRALITTALRTDRQRGYTHASCAPWQTLTSRLWGRDGLTRWRCSAGRRRPPPTAADRRRLLRASWGMRSVRPQIEEPFSQGTAARPRISSAVWSFLSTPLR